MSKIAIYGKTYIAFSYALFNALKRHENDEHAIVANKGQFLLSCFCTQFGAALIFTSEHILWL